MELDDESKDVFHSSIHEHYSVRPKQLEDLSFHGFCTEWQVEKNQPKSKFWYKLENGFFIRKKIKPSVLVTNYFSLKTTGSIERFFRSQLILYIPWRNEDEFKKSDETYKQIFDRYLPLMPILQENITIRNKIEKAQELARQIQYEATLPELTVSKENEIIVNENDNNEFHDDYSSENAFHQIDQLPESNIIANPTNHQNSFKYDVGMLNVEQKQIFEDVLKKLHYQDQCISADPLFSIVSGVAGTGKSLLIQLLAQIIEEKFGSKENSLVVLLAPTGIAAFNINGMTIHRFFKLPIHLKGRLAYKPMSNTDKKELRTLLLKVRLIIIIDEFSMVSNIMLGMIYLRLSECFGDKKHFGGKNILLFGDLLQLAPVKADYIFRQINQHDSKTVFGNMGFIDFWSCFSYSELTQNMRQKDDLLYAEMLERIRLGSPSENDIKLLEERLIKLESHKSDTDCYLPNV